MLAPLAPRLAPRLTGAPPVPAANIAFSAERFSVSEGGVGTVTITRLAASPVTATVLVSHNPYSGGEMDLSGVDNVQVQFTADISAHTIEVPASDTVASTGAAVRMSLDLLSADAGVILGEQDTADMVLEAADGASAVPPPTTAVASTPICPL